MVPPIVPVEQPAVRVTAANVQTKSVSIPHVSRVHAGASRPVPAWDTLRPEFKVIAGLSTNDAIDARLRAVHHLGKRLSVKEIDALYWVLAQGAELQPDMDVLSVNSIKNDILGVLVDQEHLPADLVGKLGELYRDKVLDPTCRDYCVQHLSLYYESRWAVDDPARQNSPERAELMKLYDEALNEPENGIAGTALTGLCRLSARFHEIDRAWLSAKALALAQDSRSDVQTRIAAFGVCGDTANPAILPMARMEAQTAGTLPLRLAAIAALGQVGTPADVELLQGMLAGSDKSVHPAAKVALKKLTQNRQ